MESYKSKLNDIFDEEMIAESWTGYIPPMIAGGALGVGLGAGVVGMASSPMGSMGPQSTVPSKHIEQDSGEMSPEFAKQMLPKKEVIKYPVSRNDADVIASTLIGEAGGEGEKGMQAVLNVIMNRAGGDPTKMVSVALKPLQFSYHNNKTKKQSIGHAKRHSKWKVAIKLTNKALLGKIDDITGGATHYHVYKGKSKVTPYWTHPSLGGQNSKAETTEFIGNHAFLRNVD